MCTCIVVDLGEMRKGNTLSSISSTPPFHCHTISSTSLSIPSPRHRHSLIRSIPTAFILIQELERNATRSNVVANHYQDIQITSSAYGAVAGVAITDGSNYRYSFHVL